MIKNYVLDTNILMSTEGKAIEGFLDNNVIITHVTLEELDGLKNAPGETGYQARESIRVLDSIVEDNNPKIGVKLSDGGLLFIVPCNGTSNLPPEFNINKPDNKILSTVLEISKNEPGIPAVLITNDVAMKLKAQSVGIEVQGYINDQITTEISYTGRAYIEVPSNVLDKLYKITYLANEDFIEELVENQYVILKSNTTNQSALCVYRNGALRLLEKEEAPEDVFGIHCKNSGQRFAMEALSKSCDEIPLVILKGCAGSGKTLISIASALDQTYDSKAHRKYDKIIITRSNTLSDKELGALPGDLEEKMGPLLLPFFDNLKFLFGLGGEEPSMVSAQIEDLIADDVIEITSLAYIRGRSLSNTFIIVDEAQNLTRTQAKTLVTRVGVGSKLVLLGDPDQIDNPKLDKKNNGLAYISEAFKGSKLCAQVGFFGNESVRSDLAKEAIGLLG